MCLLHKVEQGKQNSGHPESAVPRLKLHLLREKIFNLEEMVGVGEKGFLPCNKRPVSVGNRRAASTSFPALEAWRSPWNFSSALIILASVRYRCRSSFWLRSNLTARGVPPGPTGRRKTVAEMWRDRGKASFSSSDSSIRVGKRYCTLLLRMGPSSCCRIGGSRDKHLNDWNGLVFLFLDGRLTTFDLGNSALIGLSFISPFETTGGGAGKDFLHKILSSAWPSALLLLVLLGVSGSTAKGLLWIDPPTSVLLQALCLMSTPLWTESALMIGSVSSLNVYGSPSLKSIDEDVGSLDRTLPFPLGEDVTGSWAFSFFTGRLSLLAAGKPANWRWVLQSLERASYHHELSQNMDWKHKTLLPFRMTHWDDIGTLVLTRGSHKRAKLEWGRRIFKNVSVRDNFVINSVI